MTYQKAIDIKINRLVATIKCLLKLTDLISKTPANYKEGK